MYNRVCVQQPVLTDEYMCGAVGHMISVFAQPTDPIGMHKTKLREIAVTHTCTFYRVYFSRGTHSPLPLEVD